ncbi:MAG: diguanylate cyclase [Ruminococcus sp.]|nr:diguanylate cyclase [Ruminococcus sp.]
MDFKNIAVVVSGLDEEYQYNIIKGINQFALEHEINVSYFAAFGGVVESRRFDLGEYSIYNLTNFSAFDGALLMANTFSDPEIRGHIVDRVRESGIPVVIFESDDYPEFYEISIDNYSVMKELVEHIIRHHSAKVINYISGPLANPEARQRYDAFCAAMEENGIEIDEDRIFYGFFRSYDGKRAIEEFVESGMALPDAFICANDSMALTAASALEKLGYRVPEDVIVTGFDNTFSARNSCPSLTTVSRPLFNAGYTACEILYNVLCGKEQPKSTKLEASVVLAESCGCNTVTAEDLKEYRKRTYRRIEDTNSNINLLNRLTAGLSDTKTSEETFDVIESIVRELDCDKFCLCLTSDWQDNYDIDRNVSIDIDYSEFMTAPLIWEKGERRKISYFPSSQMFPEKLTTGGNINYFLPLHFGERCLGYYIISNGEYLIYSLLCYTLTMNISNSIENVRKLHHLNKAMEELNRLYVIDPLCNIYNRNGFINKADDMFRRCVDEHRRVMLSFIDMDGLKFINDNYGHNEGDFAIQRLATIIQDCCSRNSICARFGGDEFIIFSVNVKRDEDVNLERRFNEDLENMNRIINKPYKLSASLGSVIQNLKEGDTLYSMIKLADDKMYDIKKQKKKARKSEKV